jgi:signal peptidase II
MAGVPSARWLWLVLGVTAADRATKYAIERLTEEGYRRQLLPGIAFLVHNVNSGMAFGMFSESTPPWVSAALIGASAIVIFFLGWFLLSGRVEDVLAQAGLALIVGGAAGNLFDRILHGGVTDFLELRAGRFRWPAFNVADSTITVGALLIAYALLRTGPPAARERV